MIQQNPFDKQLLSRISSSLRERSETISVAESVTTGLLQVALGSVEHASEFYQGGITVYNGDQKSKHLNVDPIQASSQHGVSQGVADEMAQQCCSFFRSDWAIGIVGFATLVPGETDELFAWFAIAYQKHIVERKKILAPTKDPFAAQVFYSRIILEHLDKLI